MIEVKAFVNNENKAVLTCPECKAAKLMNVSKFSTLKKAVRLKVRCAECRYQFKAVLERRQFYRKEVKLSGNYMNKSGSIKGPMTINDISRRGVNMEVWDISSFKEGAKFTIEFRLDDAHGTEIRKDVLIRSISGLNIGAEFLGIDQGNVYDKALGFYLM